MKAVLLDRDGTVIVDPPDLRVDSVEEIKLFPDTISALQLLAKSGFKIILISNQAGIAEGRYTLDDFRVINAEVVRRLSSSGAEIIDTFVCPHSEQAGCDCRKPKPGLILQAAQKYDLDLSDSYMIGDRLSDIEAGLAAGTKTILVETGNSAVKAEQATFTAKDLTAAVKFIISH